MKPLPRGGVALKPIKSPFSPTSRFARLAASTRKRRKIEKMVAHEPLAQNCGCEGSSMLSSRCFGSGDEGPATVPVAMTRQNAMAAPISVTEIVKS